MRLLILISLLALSCSAPGGDQAEPATDAAGEPRSARTLNIPGGDPAGEMPADHPPAGAGGDRTLHWDMPAGWIQEQPRSNMRIAQFRVPGADGDGECIVYYFGPGQGGDARSNAARWAGQFKQPDGRDSLDVMRFTELDGTSVRVRIVEVTGIYDGGMTMTDAPAEQVQNAMLLGGIADGPDAPWFFKFTGPESTVRSQSEAFIGMMRSLHPGH